MAIHTIYLLLQSTTICTFSSLCTTNDKYGTMSFVLSRLVAFPTPLTLDWEEKWRKEKKNGKSQKIKSHKPPTIIVIKVLFFVWCKLRVKHCGEKVYYVKPFVKQIVLSQSNVTSLFVISTVRWGWLCNEDMMAKWKRNSW